MNFYSVKEIIPYSKPMKLIFMDYLACVYLENIFKYLALIIGICKYSFGVMELGKHMYWFQLNRM